uniref:SCP domain-containing protein n=1 Tax=Parascaris univalens TaxID=6257 RepID=A0A915C8H9_PARUN
MIQPICSSEALKIERIVRGTEIITSNRMDSRAFAATDECLRYFPTTNFHDHINTTSLRKYLSSFTISQSSS